MKENRLDKVLFWGVLPPATVDGVSISNSININILSKEYMLDTIQEKDTFSEHGKFSFTKFIKHIKCIFKICKNSFLIRYKYFYLVYSLSTFGALKTLIAVLCFKVFNRGKVVLHIHRGDFFTLFYNVQLNKVLTGIVFHFTAKIIILSEKQRPDFESTFRKNFFVLPNTVEYEKYPGSKNINNKKFLFVSNYLVEKGIVDLLQVFIKISSKFREIELHTYGSFPNQRIKEELFQYKSFNIYLNDTITADKKFNEIANSDCLILPSWNEGQPIVLLEAMSLGIPIIASDVGLIKDLLGLDYPYLFTPRDKISLENTIIKFIGSTRNNQVAMDLKKRYDDLYSNKLHEHHLMNIFT